MSIMKRIWTRFYAPLAAGICMLTVAPSVSVKGPNAIAVSFFVFSITMPAPAWLADHGCVLVGLLGLALIVFAASANFSGFFPTRVEMDVYFDATGLVEQLKKFTDSEKKAMKLSSAQWRDVQQDYRKGVATVLASEGPPGAAETWLSGITDENVSAKGETTFKVSRQSLLRYRIDESEGKLELAVTIPRVQVNTLVTQFTLQGSPSNNIQLDISHVVRGMALMLTPRFRQVIVPRSESLEKAPFDHIVVSATRVRGLPRPSFGPTVYLLEVNEGGRKAYVPVAYAIYGAKHFDG